MEDQRATPLTNDPAAQDCEQAREDSGAGADLSKHGGEDSQGAKPNGYAEGFAKAPEQYTTAQLRHMQFPPLLWNVPGLLCEGTHILAGRPKAGKSQLVLQLAASMATGHPALEHFQPSRSFVIYYALEDGPRRLQRRLEELERAGQPWPDDILVRHPPLSAKWDKRLEALEEKLRGFEQDEPAVLFIDTWGRFRPVKKGGDAYQDDYLPMSELAAVGQGRPYLTIVATHHTNKRDHEGEVTALVSGTHGLTGAVDGVVVLDRKTGQQDGVFTLTGRDAGEQVYTLHMDDKSGIWRYVGQGDMRATGDELAIIAAIIGIGGAASPAAVAAKLGKDGDEFKALKKRMERMAKGDSPKLVRVSRGMYAPAAPGG